jgi:hypothetical protein
MAIREERDERDALYEEAKATFESARADFERLLDTVSRAIAEGRVLTEDDLRSEERARARLFLARVRLSKREPP